MKTAKSIQIALGALAAFAAGYCLRSATTQAPESTTERVAESSKKQIDDAVWRWSRKAATSIEHVRREYSPQSMFIPTTNQGIGMTCIQLQISNGSLGGEPVYCYKNDTDELVAEYSDVE